MVFTINDNKPGTHSDRFCIVCRGRTRHYNMRRVEGTRTEMAVVQQCEECETPSRRFSPIV